MERGVTYRILFFLFLLNHLTQAQDLEKLGKKDAIKINGALSYSSVFYNASGIANRRQPFTYFITGNLTGNVLGISLPFTFNYSNNQINYTQPYNIQSFNPSYKWIKGYAGITSMNFSQYTMSNHIFTGTGVELTPKNFKFALLYGRFRKATGFDFENNTDVNLSYKRIGWGASAGYEKGGYGLRLIYFSAKDDPYSINYVPINTNITPMANTVVSLVGKTKVFKLLTLEAEFALSGLTKNINTAIDVNTPPDNLLPVLFKPNGSSQFYSAYKSSLGYKHGIFGINFNYERVNPGYRTLGAYYFNNDLENFTLSPAFSCLNGKLNISANTGVQKNNLDNNKLNTTQRWVSSLNLTYAPSQSWNFNGSYSNFSSYTKQRPQNDPFYKNVLDTLNFYQLSQNANTSVSYNFGGKAYKHNVILNAAYQVTGQNQGALNNPGAFGFNGTYKLPAKVLNLSAGYSLLVSQSKTAIMPSFNLNRNIYSGYEVLYYGPGFNLNQGFNKNMIRVTLGSVYNEVISNNQKTNEVLNHRLSANYSPKLKNQNIGKINFSLSTIYLQRLKSSGATMAFKEFTGNLGLNYSF